MHSDLIARLEAADGPCRELDRALMLIQHEWTQRKLSDVANHQEWCWVNRETDRWRTTARHGFTFTASIDAALTLVPSTMNATIDTRKPAAATLGGEWVYAATPALAIVIAALRAGDR